MSKISAGDGPLRIRRDHTFGGARSFGRRGRLSIFGRIARHAAVGVVRVRAGRCDSGKRRWGAGLLRFIPSDEPPSPVAFDPGDEPTLFWPVAGTWSLDMVSDPGDYIGLGRRFTIHELARAPDGYLSAFHITFEQHCEFDDAAIRGEFRFRAS